MYFLVYKDKDQLKVKLYYANTNLKKAGVTVNFRIKNITGIKALNLL